jgi:molecular chaperone Hsp33
MELRDELVRTVAADGCASIRVLAATNLVRDAVHRHATSPVASVALARTLMGGLLLATETQDGERVQIQVRGDGPLGTITVTADASGAVRGYVQHPDADVPLRGESLGISDAVGLGALAVERNHPRWKSPYSGIVPLVEGEIAQDLARYLLESEQKPSTLVLGVYLGRDGRVEAAGGYLVQGLPGAEDEALARLEQRVERTRHPSELLRRGSSVDAILGSLTEGIGHGDVERVAPRFFCPCSIERVKRAAVLLGRDEIREIISTGETLEVRCAFCAEVYHLGPDEIGTLLPSS